MLDPHLIRSNPQEIAEACAKRGATFDVGEYSRLENKRKTLQEKVQELQEQRSKGADEIGKLVAQGGDPSTLKEQMQQVQQELKPAKKELDELLEELRNIYLNIPNIIDASVPIGKDENDNSLVLEWGEIPKLSFKPKEHYELFPKLLDFTIAGNMAGSRFSLLRGPIAQLHRALAQMMLDVHTRLHGYEEVNIPLILNRNALVNSGQLPKFEEDLFHIDGMDSYLSPTSEVGLVNLGSNTIYSAEELPLKVTAHSVCFRAEAGSYGRDVKGILRQHQFEKVELVQIVKPEQSAEALEEMAQHAQKILQMLELPYRLVTLCSGDIGFSAVKTYDLEVWLPGQDKYREVSSCSNCHDFQARRMQARWVADPKTNKKELVHTLNGSGLAVGRTLIAVLENNQTEDGKVNVPKALKPYLPQDFPEQLVP